jgi:hypothetical protein
MRVVCVIRAFGMSASSLLPGLFSEDDIVAPFDKGGPYSVSARMIRERARAKGLGRKFARVRWFTEDEVLQMMKAGPACSQSKSGKARPTSTSEGPFTAKAFMQAQKKRTKRVLDGLRTHSKSGSPGQPAKNVTPLRSAKPPRST